MTDQNSQFFAILTAIGEAKQANANALGVAWKLTSMGLGDAAGTDPIPSRLQTKLINQVRWGLLNEVKIDPQNPNIIIVEQVIPPDEGGWWIREIALYDSDGDFVAVANCAPSFKPLLSQGTGKTQVVRLHLVVTSSANVQLKIDPAIVLATREYVDTSILNVLPPNKQAGTYTQVRINERGVVQQGFNPTTLAGYGITDAMPKGAGGLMTGAPTIESALSGLRATQFISVSPNTPDKPAAINYGTGVHIHWPDGSRYAFEVLSGAANEWFGVRRLDENGQGAWRELWHSGNFTPALKADLAGAAFTGNVRVPNVAAGTVNDQAANTRFVADAIAALVASSPAALDTLAELAAALGNDPNFATTITNALAGKAAKASTLAGYGIGDSFTRDQVYTAIANELTVKADKANTLAGYGIGDSFTRDQVYTAIANELTVKADKANTLAGYGIGDAFTRDEVYLAIANAITVKASLAGAAFYGTVRVPNVAAGTVNDQAANTRFVADAIAALVASSPAALDTLAELAAALGNDPNFATTITNALAGKFDKVGGTISGQTIISTAAQSETVVGFSVQNPVDSADAWAGISLSGRYGAANLKYRIPLNTLYFRNHATDFVNIDAGTVYSNSHPCHTDVSFMMPNGTQWTTIDGERILPAGGTWAYYVSAYTVGGTQQPPKAAVVPGGTKVSGVGGTGFAWRIF